MGIYLNPDNRPFSRIFNSEIYVDHSLLIEYTNRIYDKDNNMICVSRPRRFGKSTDANMLVAYYSKGCDSRKIFDNLKISKTDNYLTHLNKHNVIHINMQGFLSKTHDVNKMLNRLTKLVFRELKKEYPDIDYFDEDDLVQIFEDIYNDTQTSFIFIIDEWDCIFREYQSDTDSQKAYLDFLRNLLKDQPYTTLAYMTGILPIKKYGTHSALNMFKEISMINPTPLENFMGFTEDEVKDLCQKFNMDYNKIKEWYDGYQMSPEISVYNHRSVVYALTDRKYENYWTSTETYEALRVYIDMNYDGLKEAVIELLSGESITINTNKFQNDMTTFKSKDDILTLLIHLGYLGYNQSNNSCYIPNKEVISAFVNSIEDSNWNETTVALLNSQKLLEATWNLDENTVAKYIELAHLDTSLLTYNNENALAYTIMLAHIAARNYYTIIREMPSGKGFADIAFIPLKDRPAMIVELKWNQDIKTAINQIKEKEYPKSLEHYKNNLLLVGINYDKKTKKHNCKIEKVLQE
ncbi:AAA family ATPase [uncultured Thomasclavelia sp.]|uniref:AAA family ATPase n=1 Tax=uncultured Thomasclavelia sp. TaxID=3025759 RepID=UPI0025D97059|nr:AAA family ATPase [uncultured Thomasclavelia sp.]